MRGAIIVVTMFAVLAVAVHSAQAGEMDLMMRGMVRGIQADPSASWSRAVTEVEGVPLIPCFIRTADAMGTMDAISRAGGRSSLVSEDGDYRAILSAHLPSSAVNEIVSREEVEFVEAATPLSPKMDTARTYSNTVVVQDGSALGVAYDGTNVVVGVVDDGFDYGNADFMDSAGVSRVQYINEMVSGTLAECTHSAIVAGTCDIVDGGQGTTHGTHVTGIAAGSDSIYTGIAPESDVMFVFNSATDASSGGDASTSLATAVIDGVSAIFGKADIMDKACVVNLSLGTSIGAHDGTSLLEEGLTELSSAKGGRIIVNAAGNEQVTPAAQPASRRDYVGGIHASIDVPAGEARGYRIGIWSPVVTFVGGTLADVWLEAGQKDSCQVAVYAYTEGRDPLDFTFPGLNTTDDSSFATADIPFGTDSLNPDAGTDGTVSAGIDIDSEDIRNSKPHATVLFTTASGMGLSSDLETRWFDVVIRSTGSACSGHMWLYFDHVSVHDFLKGMTSTVGAGAAGGAYTLADGDSLYTATIPSTAVGVISAGSWMPQKPIGSGVSEWTGDDGTTYDQSDLSAPGGTGSVTDDLSAFSSLGPTADGRTKPAIVAPGEPIISTKATNSFVSSSIRVGEDHYKSAGTSMASPHVAGIVALLLQRNNTLTVGEVRTALQVGATTTGMTAKTADPANSYGAGKIDAAQVLGSVAVDVSAYSGTGDLDGGGGSGGGFCGLVVGGSAGLPSVLSALMVAMALGALAVRRNKTL